MNSSLFAEGRKATPASSITVQRGFTAERLYSARQGEGSWISMTFDPHGRIVVGRDDVGLGRLTFRESAAEWTYESIETSLRHCRGVLWAHDSLYVSATDTPGLYRLRDLDGDDKLEDIRQLIGLDYRSRYGHGSNQIVSGPDGLIYWVIGNDVSFPEDTSPDSPYRNPQNDHLLPNPHDAGHDNRVGFILRTDPEGRNAVVIAGGFRNQVDMAFNDEGEMFTFDADMEWDVGQPWYRPIRINHIIQGGEYGWRWGTGKWPTYYVDSLPSSQDVGLGSPTGVAFGTLSNFPAAYRRALFVADWQNGRILVARLVPKGCTYGFEYDVFLEGAPLNICDFTFGPDGAMYFITGGRGSQSGLYRVRPTGETTTWGEMTVDQAIQQEAQGARQIRRELERLQFRPTPSAVDILWPHLNSPDSWLRFSARVALERQDVALWARRAITEQQTDGAITALTALARMGNPYHQPDIVRALQTHLSGRLSDDQLVAALRACELTCIRQGRPTDMTCKTLAAQISPLGPHRDPRVNQLMSDLLIYLDPSNAVSKVITLLESATTQEEQIYYADRLSRHRYGWTSESRKAMLIWLARAHTMRGGRLLKTNLQHIRDDFVAGLNDIEREELKFLMAKLMEPSESTPVVPVRPFIKHWTIEELLPVVETALDEASPDRGKERIKEASCFRCHSMEGLGTPIGPDLTHLGRRDDTRSILQSLVTPSLEIDAKYRSATYELDSGRLVTGQVVSVNGSELTIETDVVSGATETLARDAILTSYPSNVSPMPSGLLDSFTAAEIADMVAYLRRPR